MNTLSRRRFLKLIGASAAFAAGPKQLRAQTPAPRVVVVGGGFAGASAAKYLRHWSGGYINVSLIDQSPTHVSCILSNLVLNGSLGLQALTFGYDTLGQNHGVNVLQGRMMAIDSVNRRVQLQDGQSLNYDRLILAPGIDFDPVPGLDPRRIPHAWKAGPQTLLLRRQLATLPRRGIFVLTIPPAPYRCPPGPYERACLVADYIKRKRRSAKVIVLDANPDIIAEKDTFTQAFNETYAGIIEYLPGMNLLEVDSDQRIAKTDGGDFKADVLNVIPPHRAGSSSVLADVGLLSSGERWVPVKPLSYESVWVPAIHVIGDAQGTGQPKSGHIANAEAKVCADAILRLFDGESPDPAPTTNSACYSPITATTASWLTAVFAYDPVTQTMQVVPDSLGEAPAPSEENFEKMFDWATNLFADTFA